MRRSAVENSIISRLLSAVYCQLGGGQCQWSVTRLEGGGVLEKGCKTTSDWNVEGERIK